MINVWHELSEFFGKEAEKVVAPFEAWHYIVSTPNAFALVKLANRWSAYDDMLNPWHVEEDPNCWFVFFLAGDFREVVELCPVDMEFIAFERKGHLKFYKSRRILRKIDQSYPD